MFQWRKGRDETESQVMKNWQIEINLLPREYLPQSPYSLRNISFLVISFLIAGFLVMDALHITHREKELNHKNQDMLRTLNNFRQLKNNIEALRAQTALLQKRSSLLGGSITSRITWSDKLNQIYAQIPSEVWLSEIALERETIRIPSVAQESTDKQSQSTSTPPQQELQEQIRLRISGDATSLVHISELLRRLETVPFLNSIRLSSINQIERVDHLVMSFEIMAGMNIEGNTQL